MTDTMERTEWKERREREKEQKRQFAELFERLQLSKSARDFFLTNIVTAYVTSVIQKNFPSFMIFESQKWALIKTRAANRRKKFKGFDKLENEFVQEGV